MQSAAWWTMPSSVWRTYCAAEGRSGEAFRQEAAPAGSGGPCHDGGAFGDSLCHGHHRAGVHPVIRFAGAGGQAVRAASIAFIISTLASLVVSVTITPVVSFYLLPRENLDHGDTGCLPGSRCVIAMDWRRTEPAEGCACRSRRRSRGGRDAVVPFAQRPSCLPSMKEPC